MVASRVVGGMLMGCVVSVLVGCQTGGSGPRIVQAATPQQKDATLGKLMALQGTWVLTKSNGQDVAPADQGTITFSTSSQGSVVREVMFPGTDHEMTNMYHMDGSDVVVTHYCAMGNQPRMRCTGANGNSLEFKFDSATNVRSRDESCMGELTVRFVDERTIEQVWTTSKGDQREPHAVFTLTRKN
jgi:hypothetical protein